jgi:hypothetical protein
MITDPSFKRFIKESGFKVLALARLSQCEYSVILYLLNCAVSGLDQFITTESELASLVGYDDDTLRAALGELATKNIIRLHYGEVSPGADNASMRIGLQYDMSRWVLAYPVDATSRDAVVFPFRRQGQTNHLQVVEGHKKEKEKERAGRGRGDGESTTWQRVLESFVHGRNLDDEELAQAEADARMLVETHPVDQVLLMLRHFGQRVPTLSLLGSTWQHYQEFFEAETAKVDMLGARQKHSELDQKVRDQVQALLEQRDELKLTEDEVMVLQVLNKHRHPRRQLFWAYQLRSRYPNLTAFFNDNAGLMLSVTTSGAIVRKGPSQD